MNDTNAQIAPGAAGASTLFPCVKTGPCPCETPCIAAGGTSDARRVPPPPRGEQPDPETEIASGFADLRAICGILKGLAAGGGTEMEGIESDSIGWLAEQADDATERVFDGFEGSPSSSRSTSGTALPSVIPYWMRTVASTPASIAA